MAGLRGLARTVLCGVLACALAACWTSQKPLLTDTNASSVGFAGKYRGKGEDAPTVLAIASGGGTAYAFVDEKNERIPVRFLALGSEWYLLQYEIADGAEDPDPAYMYQAIRRVGQDLYFYPSNCEDVAGDFRGLKRSNWAPGAADGPRETAPRGSQTCTFSGLAGLKTVARAYIAKVEKGAITGSPSVLERLGP